MNENIALVTGGTGGIGKSIVGALRNSGWLTIVNSRTFSSESTNPESVTHMNFDCTDELDILRNLQILKDNNVFLSDLICCVGNGRIDNNQNIDSWIRYLEVNLLSCTRVIDSALRIFNSSLRNIVVISSIAGSKAMVDPPIEYSVAKAALNQYVKVKALLIAQEGKTINAIAPGNIMYPGSPWDQRLNSNRDYTLNYISTKVPLGKFGNPEDISNLVLFLLQKNSFATGQIFQIDGGQSL